MHLVRRIICRTLGRGPGKVVLCLSGPPWAGRRRSRVCGAGRGCSGPGSMERLGPVLAPRAADGPRRCGSAGAAVRARDDWLPLPGASQLSLGGCKPVRFLCRPPTGETDKRPRPN